MQRHAVEQPVPGRGARARTFSTPPSPSAPSISIPVQSYSSNEIVFIAQIYEPPLQYHYLKRPYELIPLRRGAHAARRATSTAPAARCPPRRPRRRRLHASTRSRIKPGIALPAASRVRPGRGRAVPLITISPPDELAAVHVLRGFQGDRDARAESARTSSTRSSGSPTRACTRRSWGSWPSTSSA